MGQFAVIETAVVTASDDVQATWCVRGQPRDP